MPRFVEESTRKQPSTTKRRRSSLEHPFAAIRKGAGRHSAGGGFGGHIGCGQGPQIDERTMTCEQTIEEAEDADISLRRAGSNQCAAGG